MLEMDSHSIHEFLSFALMAAFFFIVFYIDIDFPYKIFMGILIFMMVLLLRLVDVATKQLEEKTRLQPD
jgi:uncharacterized membrane protein YGL010W